MTVPDLEVADLIDRPVGTAITVRRKELAAAATVADARALFASSSVQVIPVVEDNAYLGAVLREDLPPEAGDDEPIASFATARPPTAIASTRLSDARATLDLDGGRRLVVLANDHTTYLGLACLRSDRQQLCVDAECHAAPGEGAESSPAISADADVADLVIADPSCARVFEKLGIDYCCGGKISLAAAAEALSLDPDDVIALLEEPRDRGAEDVDWTGESLAELVRHIVDTPPRLPSRRARAARRARGEGRTCSWRRPPRAPRRRSNIQPPRGRAGRAPRRGGDGRLPRLPRS